MNMKSAFGKLACLVLGASASAAAQAPHEGLASVPGVPASGSTLEWAFSRFAAGDTPPVIQPAHPGEYIQFPFGYGEARVRCARLQVCPIELQPGERLLDEPLTGDTERWIVATSESGRDGEIPIVVVKPTDCDLATNVLVPTDRRLYVLSLASEPCAEKGSDWKTVQRTKFWYPDELLAAGREEHAAGPDPDSASFAPCEGSAGINQDYEVEQRGGSWFKSDPPFAWTPTKVCDDGIRTYIQLPESARHGELPVLYQIGEGGEKEMLNYTPRGDVIVTDRVLERGALIVNGGGKERRVDITNRAPIQGDRGGR